MKTKKHVYLLFLNFVVVVVFSLHLYRTALRRLEEKADKHVLEFSRVLEKLMISRFDCLSKLTRLSRQIKSFVNEKKQKQQFISTTFCILAALNEEV